MGCPGKRMEREAPLLILPKAPLQWGASTVLDILRPVR
jgi:hypothetical protein